MPKLFVDSEKIAWVLTNLLSNAIRYSKENGRVVIGARHDGDFVEMYVQDFGKVSTRVIIRAFLTVISECRALKCKVVV